MLVGVSMQLGCVVQAQSHKGISSNKGLMSA